MHVHAREFYRSTNGDRWFLLHDTENKRVYVKYIANARSGGRQTDYEIDVFLSRRRAPERTALLQLIASLADNDSDGDT